MLLQHFFALAQCRVKFGTKKYTFIIFSVNTKFEMGRGITPEEALAIR